jgi:hypothetical protein
MDYVMEDPIRTALFALLVISLLVHLWGWARGGGSGGARMVKEGGKAWKRGAETRGAMERLEEHGRVAEVVALPQAHAPR